MAGKKLKFVVDQWFSVIHFWQFFVSNINQNLTNDRSLQSYVIVLSGFKIRLSKSLTEKMAVKIMTFVKRANFLKIFSTQGQFCTGIQSVQNMTRFKTYVTRVLTVLWSRILIYNIINIWRVIVKNLEIRTLISKILYVHYLDDNFLNVYLS